MKICEPFWYIVKKEMKFIKYQVISRPNKALIFKIVDDTATISS